MVTEVFEPGEDNLMGFLVEGHEYETLTGDQFREMIAAFIDMYEFKLFVVRKPDGRLVLLTDDNEGYMFEKAA